MSLDIYAPEYTKNILKQTFINLGYPEDYLRLDWQFVHPQLIKSGQGEEPPIVDLAAFTHHSRHNLDTRSMVAKIEKTCLPSELYKRKQIAEKLKYTLAPVLILADSQRADIWLNGNGYGLKRKETFTLDKFTTEFPNKYQKDFSPQALAKVRGGQLTFFDMGYLDFTGLYNVTREALVGHFHEGVIKARQLLDVEPAQEEALSRVAISLLAARILEDKGYFGDLGTPTLNPHELLKIASDKADAFFTHTIENDLRLFSDEVLRNLMAHLTGSITFRGVTEEMIGYFYEKALVSERRREEIGLPLGRYYTSSEVARNMLNRLPIENIRPEKRHIIDPACGSGSFLLAATDRLDNLYDAREVSLDKNTYLEKHITGNDIDPIALQVARLSYLLNHVSRGNQGEPIQPTLMEKDALTLTEQDFNLTPSIIVGNPPFYEDPEQHDQIATRFLNKALELLPDSGYLAMIMPQSFLNSDRQGCPEAREKLLESCELLEIWKMPEKTIGLESEHPTAAILAFRSNGGKNKSPVRIYQTVSRKRGAANAIYEHGRFTFSYVLPNAQSWRKHPKNFMLTSPLESLWALLQNSRQVGNIADIWPGIHTRHRGKKGEYSAKRPATDGWELYLAHQKTLEPYYVTDKTFTSDKKFVRYEKDSVSSMRGKRKQDFLRSKLVLTSNTNQNARIRFRSAIDTLGTFPEHDFRCLKIKQEYETDYTLAWLAGVLNAPIAQAWVSSWAGPKQISKMVLESIPLPKIVDNDIAKLVERHRYANANEREAVREEIDRLVLRSYGITQEEWTEIERFIEGMIEPWVEGTEEAHRHVVATQTVTGHVISLQLSGSVEEQQIELFINAFCHGDETINIRIPKFMPGWALRVGQTFKARLDKSISTVGELEENPYALHDFRPLPYAYKSYTALVKAVFGEQIESPSLQESFND